MTSVALPGRPLVDMFSTRLCCQQAPGGGLLPKVECPTCGLAAAPLDLGSCRTLALRALFASGAAAASAASLARLLRVFMLHARLQSAAHGTTEGRFGGLV